MQPSEIISVNIWLGTSGISAIALSLHPAECDDLGLISHSAKLGKSAVYCPYLLVKAPSRETEFWIVYRLGIFNDQIRIIRRAA